MELIIIHINYYHDLNGCITCQGIFPNCSNIPLSVCTSHQTKNWLYLGKQKAEITYQGWIDPWTELEWTQERRTNNSICQSEWLTVGLHGGRAASCFMVVSDFVLPARKCSVSSSPWFDHTIWIMLVPLQPKFNQ